MENTLENKAKFFAQYWGQKIAFFQLGMMVGEFTIKFDSQFQALLNKPEYGWDKAYLELKPLSSITDEDLLSAISIVDYKNEFTELGAIEIGRENIEILSDINSEVARNDIHPQYFFHFVDFLRSKGYALPFMGLSVETLIEYGWIKLK